MGKHDSDETEGFILGGVTAIKNIGLWFVKHIKIFILIVILPIIACGSYFLTKYIIHKKRDNTVVPVVASQNKEDKEYLGGYEVIGNVKVNSLGIDVKVLNPVLDEVDYTEDALKYGAVKYYGEELNESGNCVILAHDDSQNFFNLKNIEKDDEIIAVNSDGVEVKYTVIEINKVDSADFSGFLPLEENSTELTLITCDDGATTRFVVKAISK